MINLILPIGETLATGKQITFKAFHNSDDEIYSEGFSVNGEHCFHLVDANGEHFPLSNAFSEGALVSVILDVESQLAYVQNGAISSAVSECVAEYLTEHDNNKVASSNGAHGIRYYDGKLQVYKNDKWINASSYTTYGVQIVSNNSDPYTSVRYLKDAEGMTAGDVSWDSMPIFKDIKPCVMRDGKVLYYLNPNNFAKKLDGSDADITTLGNDVMIEIPKIGVYIQKGVDSVVVYITDDPNANERGFNYSAHSKSTEGDTDKLYISAYLAHVPTDSETPYSSSGKEVYRITHKGVSNTRAMLTQNKGVGYYNMSFHAMTLLQCLYLIKYKNLNSQAALGYGTLNSIATTGGTDDKGMYYGDTTYTSSSAYVDSQVKFAGIEDLWGGAGYIIDDVYADSVGNIYTCYPSHVSNIKNDSDNRTKVGSFTNEINGYFTTPLGGQAGFLPKDTGGSSFTYYSDIAGLKKNCFAFMSSPVSNVTKYPAGIFSIQLTCLTDFIISKEDNIGMRFMYL